MITHTGEKRKLSFSIVVTARETYRKIDERIPNDIRKVKT